MKAIFKYLSLNFKSMRFSLFFNQIYPTKKNSLSVYYGYVDLKEHVSNNFRKRLEKIWFCSKKKSDCPAKCLAQKNEREKPHCVNHLQKTSILQAQPFAFGRSPPTTRVDVAQTGRHARQRGYCRRPARR